MAISPLLNATKTFSNISATPASFTLRGGLCAVTAKRYMECRLGDAAAPGPGRRDLRHGAGRLPRRRVCDRQPGARDLPTSDRHCDRRLSRHHRDCHGSLTPRTRSAATPMLRARGRRLLADRYRPDDDEVIRGRISAAALPQPTPRWTQNRDKWKNCGLLFKALTTKVDLLLIEESPCKPPNNAEQTQPNINSSQRKLIFQSDAPPCLGTFLEVGSP
jgi:hypothetical protein